MKTKSSILYITTCIYLQGTLIIPKPFFIVRLFFAVIKKKILQVKVQAAFVLIASALWYK